MKWPTNEHAILPPAYTRIGSTDRRQLIHTEQIRLLYRQAPGLFLGASVGALILVLVLWGQIPRATLFMWLSSVSTAHLVIAVLWLLYQRYATSLRSGEPWDRLYTVAVGLGGAAWGAAGYILYVPGALDYQLFLALLLFAAAAAGLASTAIYPPAFYACFISILLPLAVRSALQADLIHLALASVTVIYGMVLGFFARNIYRALSESLELRFANVELVRELIVKMEEAEKASKAKSSFLAAASHDLRQPLHTIGLFLDALGRRIRGSESRIIVDKIRSSLNSLENQFNAMLDLSKFDAGVLTPRIQSFPINMLLDRMRAEFAPLADAKGLSLRVVPSSLFIRSDPDLMERLLRNLVSNAVNYTRHGGIVMGCRRRAGHAQIEIWDSGIGIPEDKQKEIFQEFYQIGNLERDRNKGFGLGLAIVDRIARLLEHRIELRSRPEKGSVFSLEAPVVDSRDERGVHDVNAVPESSGYNLGGRFVVVLEDDRAALEAMQRLLEDWGCRVLAANSADDAIEQLAVCAQRPDAIVADYRLYDRYTGVQAIALLKGELKADIPGILITGDTGSTSLRDIQMSGHHLLHKPVRPAKLRALLSYAIRNRSSVHFNNLPREAQD